MDYYLTALVQGLCYSAIALGIYLSMKIFNIPDITTDGSYTLGGAVTAGSNYFRRFSGNTYRTDPYKTQDQCTVGRYPGDDVTLCY
jgi:hypothetical protein